ncbi:hypothetical protein FRX31_026890 [Thalictrum thalictroides]|uniref:Uncharacterized protein n=1 Tax=Thalictrum thalictroides TaxID=46969 RepID=A0A7J6VFS0_THATH|nr:hypothetical protein FRX31_026890 [Thalictrum thalictroides]
MVEAVSAKPLCLICPYSSQRQISFLLKTNFISLRPQNFHLSQCTKFQLLKPSNKSLQFSGFGFNLKSINNRNLWFHSNAYDVEQGGKMKGVVVDESEKAPGESTMPSKEGTDHPVWLSWLFGLFNLNKEALDHLLRLAWLIALAFGIYA